MESLQAVAKEYTAAVYREDMVTEEAGVFQRAGVEITGGSGAVIMRSAPSELW